MKRSIALLLLAFASATIAQAGSIGGPPPFTNGSPLPSGVNGTYQASARGNNLSGVISFTYSGGIQTSTFFGSGNAWVIFYEGQVYSGTTDAAIMDGNISGVLETSFSTPVSRTSSTSTSSSTSNPFASSSRFTSTVLAALARPSGYFNAKLDNNSATGSFKGKGVLSGVFSTTNTSTGTDFSGGNSTSGSTTTVTTQTINAPFKVKGVRLTTGT